MSLGSGNNGEFTFLDCVSILSFLIGVENLDMNLTQEDAQELQRQLSEKTDLLLNEIHGHLEEQDMKLDTIMKWLGIRGGNDDSSGDIQ